MGSVIDVKLPQQSYQIVIEAQSLDDLGKRMRSLNLGNKVLVVSNKEIFRHYGQRAKRSLELNGFDDVATYTIPAGEEYKTLATVQEIYDAAENNGLERSSTLVALGGGVIGDMTGFAAATWLRGIDFVQVPTTLLAMVDASIGGKTGVNLPKRKDLIGGKNQIGAFYQPKLVLIDPQVLKTLPDREFRAGIAEVIKYGIIWDVELFKQMEQSDRLDELRYLNPDLLQAILSRSCQAKADVVSKDEKESGLRAILNYGHTIGHAVESVTEYRLINHGEGVAIGMVAAGKLAVELEMWQQEDAQRQDALIQKAGLPTQLPPGLDIDQIIAASQTDKKVEAGEVKFVLPTKIGAVKVNDKTNKVTHTVQPDTIRQVLQQMQP